jgi:hypothetical protein
LTGLVSDVTFRSNYIQQPTAGTSPGVSCASVLARVTFEDNTIDMTGTTDPSNFGFRLEQECTDVTFRNNHITAGPSSCIRTIAAGTNLRILDNHFINSGVFAETQANMIVRGNTFEGTGSLTGTNVRVIGNHFKTDTRLAVSATGGVVSGNTCDGSAVVGSNAMTISGTNVVVTDNVISHASPNNTQALDLNGLTHYQISGNRISHQSVPWGATIAESGASDYNAVVCNHVTPGRILLYGPNSIQRENFGVN